MQMARPKTNYAKDVREKRQNGGYDGNNLDLMLMLQEKGDIKGFNATPSETMDLLASFKDFSMRQKDPQYKGYFFNKQKNSRI